MWGDSAAEVDAPEGRKPDLPFRAKRIRKDTAMDLLTFAKNIADRVEAENCPQHITPRFTEQEIAEAVGPLRDRLARLESENAELRARLANQGDAR
jgi:hypothetical protein